MTKDKHLLDQDISTDNIIIMNLDGLSMEGASLTYLYIKLIKY